MKFSEDFCIFSRKLSQALLKKKSAKTSELFKFILRNILLSLKYLFVVFSSPEENATKPNIKE